MNHRRSLLITTTSLMAAALLAGCGSDSNDNIGGSNDNMSPAVETSREYQVTVTNLTAAQPFSPLAVVVHDADWAAYTVGSPASVPLERIAESGDNGDFLTEATDSDDVYTAQSGTGVLLPGLSETMELETNDTGAIYLSVVTMLVNTNDAITGMNKIDIADLAVGETINHHLRSYDAGTEANSETADTIPGPAAAGGSQEGFSAARDDLLDQVLVHPGVVTSDDGLVSSTLTQVNRWDNPVAHLLIERIR